MPPRVDRRARHPVRRPQPDRPLQERVRHRRVRPRPARELARARLRLPRRDPLPRRRRVNDRAATRSRSRTRSASTRRTTGSSGSTTTTAPAATDVARSRRLVISSIATVGNYEYGFYWYLYQDGTIEFEVKLTGDPAHGRRARGRRRRRTRPRSRRASPRAYHQHFFCARLDMDVDGDDEHGRRDRRAPGAAHGLATPTGARSRPTARVLDRESQARRVGALGGGAALAGRERRAAEPHRRADRLRARPGRGHRADGAARLGVPAGGRGSSTTTCG